MRVFLILWLHGKHSARIFAEAVEDCPPPSDAEVKKLEDFIATRTYHLTLIRPTVYLVAADLPEYDVTKKKTVVHRKSKKVFLVQRCP